MQLAFSSKHSFVPNPKKDINATRWIASLSDGSTIFEDKIPYEKSAWRRLSEYIKVHSLKITNLRLEAYGRQVILIPYRDANGNAQLNGYWHSKMISALLTDNGSIQSVSCGIGYLKGREIVITWVNFDGTIRQEVRPFKEHDEALIINDVP